ncbi:hypothetical protein AVEN_58966-1 [Araneus ventricosus]|uniref:Uncharacterized protein n=1 Tax=Araneus ventricosus TaxID=182803 RepID=A0A4Y2GR77_ARAVE|nr:hypothetical protein AVEN_58966-1 [Araneus ventricosus]
MDYELWACGDKIKCTSRCIVKGISYFPTSAVVCRVETESLEVAGEGPMASGELDAFSGPVQLFVRYFRYNAVNRSASLAIIPLSLPTRVRAVEVVS